MSLGRGICQGESLHITLVSDTRHSGTYVPECLRVSACDKEVDPEGGDLEWKKKGKGTMCTVVVINGSS